MKENKKKYVSPLVFCYGIEMEHGLLAGSKKVTVNGTPQEIWTNEDMTVEFDWDNN